VGERSSEAIDPGDDEGVSSFDAVQDGLELRPVAVATGGVLAEDLGAAELPEVEELSLGRLT
jgi:hypothetical protein